jgi:phosphatidylserine decarboxylase
VSCLITCSIHFAQISTSFVVVSVLNTRQQTPVAKRTLNPTYRAKDATFDFPLYLSLADQLGVVEFVVWDKDMLSKEYLGEVALPLDDWFVDKQTGRERSFGFDHPGNEVSLYLRTFCYLTSFFVVLQSISLNLVSARASTLSTGSVRIKLGFTPTSNTHNLLEFDEIYTELIKCSRPSLVSAPPVSFHILSFSRSNTLPFSDGRCWYRSLSQPRHL